MKLDDVLTLLKSGYTRQEIESWDTPQEKPVEKPVEKPDEKPDEKPVETTTEKASSFDYAKFAEELVKAQRKAAFHDDHSNSANNNFDIGKLF